MRAMHKRSTRGGWLLCLWVLALLLAGCRRPAPTSPLVLNDFESQADLDRLVWRCRTTFSLTDSFHSHGQAGLLMTMYPAPYPGLQPLLTPRERDWRGYRRLALEVDNPQSEPLTLAYRIDDQANPDYDNRVNGSFRLPPGPSHLALDLAQLRTSGGKRPLNLARIEQLLLFTVSPTAPLALKVDYLRLEP